MGFFSDNRTTTTNNTQEGSTTGQQSFGSSPIAQNYAQYLASVYGSGAGQPNQWQTQALSTQSGMPAAYNPAISGSFSIGNTGISPSSIQSFMNPYTQSVVDATQAQFGRSNALAQSQDQANAVKMGVPLMKGTQGAVNRNLGQYTREQAQAPVIAGLYSQGYGQAAQLAAQDAQTRLQGYNQGTSALTQQGAQNQALFGQGTTAGMQPYQVANMGAQGIGSLTPYTGSSTSGTSQGTSSGTSVQENNPSMFSNIMGVVGPALAAFSDERVKDNIKPIGETYDGQPIYKYNYKGDPKTQIGLMAQDVEQHTPEAVGSFGGIKTVDYDRATQGSERKKLSEGGSVGITPYKGNSAETPHDRLASAFSSIRSMLSKAHGGPVMKPFAMGGDVGMGSWDATVKPASMFDSFDSKKFGEGLGKSGQKRMEGDGGAGALQGQQSALASSLGQLQQSTMAGLQPRAGFDDGGVVWGEGGDDTLIGAGEREGLTPFRGRDIDTAQRPITSIGRGYTPAAVRYNNPGAQYPGPSASKFGSTGYEVIGGGHKIAKFPDVESGAAAQFDLLDRRYAGMPLAAAITKWSGGNSPQGYIDQVSKATGIAPDAILTRDMIRNPAVAVPLARAAAKWETGRDYPMTDEQWNSAHTRAFGPSTPSDPEMPGLVPGAPRVAGPISPYSGESGDGGTRIAGYQTRAPQGEVGPAADKGFFGRGGILGTGLMSDGIWTGQQMTPMQRLGIALAATKSPTMNGAGNGFAEAALSMDAGRREQSKIEQEAARLSGMINGIPTMDAQRLKEEQYQKDKPVWGVIGQDQYGVPQYGWISAGSMVPPREGAASAPASGGAPAAPVTSSGVPATESPGQTPITRGTAEQPANVPGSATRGITPGPITQNRGDTSLTGEPFLNTLNAEDQKRVKAIAEYREPFPTALAARGGRGAFLAQAVAQYDPSYDATQYAARQQQQKNYRGGGKQFQELQAISTVAGHLHDLMEDADKLDNYSSGFASAPLNWARLKSREFNQDPVVKKFNSTKQAVSNELSKAYRGGHVTEGDVKEWQQNISAADSPEQLKSVIGGFNQLLMSKRSALEEGYRQTMGEKAPIPQEFSSVSEAAKKKFDEIAAWSLDLKEKKGEKKGEEKKAEKPKEDPRAKEAVALLKRNPSPEMQANFDKIFGEGAAKRALGQ